MVLVVSISCQAFQNAPRDIDGRGIEHGVVIGKRHVLKHHPVIIFVEGSPAAVLALHRQYPIDCALHRLGLVTSVRMLDPAQAETDHGAVIDVGVELVVEFEIPAAGLALGILDLPVARLAHLFLKNPVGALHEARIGGWNPRLAQGKQRVRSVPHGRLAGLHTKRIALFNSQLFKLIERADELRIVHRISLAAQRDDRVHDRRINSTQAVAHLEALQHPLLSLAQSNRAQRTDVHTFRPMRDAIKHQKEIAPRNQLLVPVQMHARFVAAAYEEFFDSHFVRNFLERLLGVADGKRHENRARPRRNLVDVKPEPVRKQHDLRRHGRYSVVIVLPKEAEIDFGECIDFSNAAHRKNFFAGARQRGMIGRKSSQLQPKVGLHRGADVGRAASVNAPPAIFILMVQYVTSGLVEPSLIARTEQRVQQDVIGFKGRIGF